MVFFMSDRPVLHRLMGFPLARLTFLMPKGRGNIPWNASSRCYLRKASAFLEAPWPIWPAIRCSKAVLKCPSMPYVVENWRLVSVSVKTSEKTSPFKKLPSRQLCEKTKKPQKNVAKNLA